MATHNTSGSAVRWAMLIGLLFVCVGLGLVNAQELALQHWYLLSAPLIVAAFRFGLRGATVAAGVSVLVLLVAFKMAGRGISDAENLLVRLTSATTSLSLDELTELGRQVADLRAADPETAFARSLVGLVLVVASSVMLGVAVDAQRKALAILERAFHAMRRYFSPQIIDRILTQSDNDTVQPPASRKEITVLFADLRGFTAMVERMEPEEVAKLLNEFFGAMTEEIFRQDGTLDKFIGDAVMAFFGDPVWYADHPERAFRAAIAMQERMRDLESRWQAEGREVIGMGIGISTGTAIVGNTGSPERVDYTAIGSTVNIAARLTDLARAGQILTTRKTYWRVQGMVEGLPREPVNVKGFAQPVEIVEIIGARLLPQATEAAAASKLAEVVYHVVNDSAYRALLLSSPDEATNMYGLTSDQRDLAQYIAVLLGYPIFQGVPDAEIAVLVEAVTIEHCKQGAVIVHQGAEEECFYLIALGDATVTTLDDMQRERHIASLARGDCFGEVALLFDTTRTATVRAASDSVFLMLRGRNFYEVLAQTPTFKRKLEVLARSRMDRPFAPRLTDGAANGPAPAVPVPA